MGIFFCLNYTHENKVKQNFLDLSQVIFLLFTTAINY